MSINAIRFIGGIISQIDKDEFEEGGFTPIKQPKTAFLLSAPVIIQAFHLLNAEAEEGGLVTTERRFHDSCKPSHKG